MTRTPGRARWWARALALPAAVATVAALAAPAVAALAAPAGAALGAAAADTTPPTTPGPVQVAEITETTIRLTWTASTDDVGVVSYEVNQAFTDILLRRTTPTNSIFINGLQRSRVYSWSVSALDAAGNRSPGVFLRVVMPPGDSQPPTAPGAPIVTDTADTSVTLGWPPSSDNVLLAQYEVVRITDGDTTVVARVWLLPPGSPSSSVRVTGLTADTTYTFAVRARDEAGNVSANSPTVTVTTRGADTQPPTAPGTPTASEVTPNGLTLSWAPATDDIGVVRYVVVDRGVFEVGTVPGTTIVLGATPDTRYDFVVYAEDAAGNRSPASGPLTVTTPPQLGCAVTYQITAQWPGAFQAMVTLRNTGSTAIDGWNLAWTFPGGQEIFHIWSARAVDLVGPQVEVRNQTWNGRVPPGASVSFGFHATWQGTNAVPVGFVLNGTPCQFL
jgi:chitodextrinase